MSAADEDLYYFILYTVHIIYRTAETKYTIGTCSACDCVQKFAGRLHTFSNKHVYTSIYVINRFARRVLAIKIRETFGDSAGFPRTEVSRGCGARSRRIFSDVINNNIIITVRKRAKIAFTGNLLTALVRIIHCSVINTASMPNPVFFLRQCIYSSSNFSNYRAYCFNGNPRAGYLTRHHSRGANVYSLV